MPVHTRYRSTILSSAAVLALALAGATGCSNADMRAASPTAANTEVTITESEVLASQRGWCAALVSISTTHATQGQPAAKALAEQVIDQAYGYNMGPVLFKPTLTMAPQTFRTTRDGALAYFVGGDPNFPNDYGFALNDWTGCEPRNAAIHINGNMALTMGNVAFTNKAGVTTTVDKTWAFQKGDDGSIRIVLHHSSLPHTAN